MTALPRRGPSTEVGGIEFFGERGRGCRDGVGVGVLDTAECGGRAGQRDLHVEQGTDPRAIRQGDAEFVRAEDGIEQRTPISGVGG